MRHYRKMRLKRLHPCIAPLVPCIILAVLVSSADTAATAPVGPTQKPQQRPHASHSHLLLGDAGPVLRSIRSAVGAGRGIMSRVPSMVMKAPTTKNAADVSSAAAAEATDKGGVVIPKDNCHRLLRQNEEDDEGVSDRTMLAAAAFAPLSKRWSSWSAVRRVGSGTLTAREVRELRRRGATESSPGDMGKIRPTSSISNGRKQQGRRVDDLSLPGDASSLDPTLAALGATTASTTAAAAATTSTSSPSSTSIVDTKTAPSGISANNHKIEPGTPAGWWEKLYVTGAYPRGRRSASAAVYRVMRSDEARDEADGDRQLAEETNANVEEDKGDEEDNTNGSVDPPRTHEHGTTHAGAASTTTPKTPPTPGDPVPIPGRISPGSSSSSAKSHWKPSDYDKILNEYMVVSGGFSDDDWTGFPVWAFDMTGEKIQPAESEGVYRWYDLAEGGDGATTKAKGKVTTAAGAGGARGRAKDAENAQDHGNHASWGEDDPVIRPAGRVGHMSAIHNGHLYVFGGLLYKRKSFYLEDEAYMWRAKIYHLLPGSNLQSGDDKDDDGADKKRLVWEKVTPQIIDPSTEETSGKPALAIDEDSRFEPLPSMPTNDDDDGHDENVNDPHGLRHRNLAAIAATPVQSPYHLPRGEIQGELWHPTNSDGDDSLPNTAFVFFGGLHVTHRSNPHRYSANPSIQVDEPLGDVWMYDFDSNEFHCLAPYPPESWQVDPQTGRYPIARTAHGVTVIDDQLIVYGGMTLSSDDIGWDGTANWDALSDVWIFDLKERVWRERLMEPELARSYHSLVGWGDGSIAAFGGFRSAKTVAGDPIAFVFSDTIVSHPNDDIWQKAQWPQIYSARTITNRLEHVSVVDKDGSMIVWGGRFKSVSQVYGIWKLDVFNEDSSVVFTPAPPDGLDAYEAELEALHLLVAVMMFMSILFTALYGSLRRQQLEMAAAGGNGGPGIMSLGRRRTGLSQEAIDAFPVKTYGRNSKRTSEENEEGTETTEGNFVIDSDDDGEGEGDSNNGAGAQGLEEEETCPICLVEYADGDEVRTLSCSHEFHKDCVDGWLESHASCPACRHAFSNNAFEGDNGSSTNDERTEEEHLDPTWDNLRRSVWGEAPPFLGPQAMTLTGLLASHSILFAEHPGEGVADDGSADPPDGALGSTTEESGIDQDEDEFTSDEHGMADQERRPRRLRIGRARGYRNIGPHRRRRVTGGATEMVELGAGTSNIV